MSKLLLLFALVGCSPMIYTRGVPNLAQVDPGVWRSGEPDPDGWAYVQQLAAGRRVHVVKLNFDAEGADDGARVLGFDVQYLPVQPEGDQDAWDDARDALAEPDEVSVERAVALLATCAAHPDTDFCLVHCTHGQDRTGYVVGRYRVERDGWTKQEAWDEMLYRHFHWELVGLVRAWEQFRAP